MYQEFRRAVSKNAQLLGKAIASSKSDATVVVDTFAEKDPIDMSKHLKPRIIREPLDGVKVIYNIHLERHASRKLHMETIFSNPVFDLTQIKIISAVDGTKESPENHLEFYGGCTKNPRMMNTEYACTTSHFRAIHQFVLDAEEHEWADDTFALICEDDLSIEFVPFWRESIRDVCGRAPPTWELLQLSYILFDFTPKEEFERWEMRKNMCGTEAYLLRLSGAKRLIEYLCKFSNPTRFRYYIGPEYPYYHHADRFLYLFFRTYSTTPPLFTYRDENDSTIHADHVAFHAKSKERTKKLWLGWDASEGASL